MDIIKYKKQNNGIFNIYLEDGRVLSLYEDIDFRTINLKSIQEVNDEEDTSVVYLNKSREKNHIKKQKKVNNGNILLTSEILISDSDLSDRKIFGDKVDKDVIIIDSKSVQ